MVSVIAKNLKDRRIHKALTDIFEKADTSNDGKITLDEYLELCRNYGIEHSDDDFANIEAIAEANGGGVTKNDFILHIKQSGMVSQFDTVDPESDHHWNEKVKMAWKLFDKGKHYNIDNGDGKLTQLEFRWMTDKKMLSNTKIKLMFSKCDVDGDGVLSFGEFKEMILRNRQRKELGRLDEDNDGGETESKAMEDSANMNNLTLEQIARTQLYQNRWRPAVSKIREEDEDSAEEEAERGEVETDDEIEEELDAFESEMKMNHESSDNSDIPEEVSEHDSDEITEDIDQED